MSRTRAVAAAVVLIPMGLSLGGCNNGKRQAEVDAAVQENAELRQRIADLQDTVRDANDINAELEQQNQSLVSENAELKAAPPQPAAARTGFENMSGVDVSQRGSDIVVSVAGSVLFDSGSVTLKRSARSTLNQIASTIQQNYAGRRMRIEGHTDSDPIRKSKWGTNERLSAERALAVEEYLATRGISKDMMYIAGMGPAEPRGSKAQSRRVEIVILGG